MSFICRYVVVEDKEVEVLESSFGFISEHDIKKMVFDRLEKEKLDFKKCTGIRFNNAGSITGTHGGVQRLLRNIKLEAKFVPCSHRSPNLCGVHASAVNAMATTFFE